MNKIEEKKLFKIAKLAEEKGFKPKTFTTGFTNKYLLGGKNVMITDMCIYLWMCELQKWLREVHDIVVLIHQYTETSMYFYLIDQEYDFEYDNNKLNCETYEEALEIGLQESLKLIK